jgi:hypothetical protein
MRLKCRSIIIATVVKDAAPKPKKPSSRGETS